MSKAFEDYIRKHAADLQQAGFDYQFYIFLYYLLNLQMTESIAYETEDDIVIYHDNGLISQIQVKHSVDAMNSAIRDLDPDFWNAINIWLTEAEIHALEHNNNSFLKNHLFIIVTNKRIDNLFYEKIRQLQSGTIEVKEIKEYLTNDIKSENLAIEQVISRLKRLTPQKLREFLMRIRIKVIIEPIQAIYSRIRTIYHSDEDACEVLDKLLGRLIQDKYNDARNRHKLRINRQDFDIKYKNIFNLKRNLPDYVLEYIDDFDVPEHLTSMIMYKQLELIDINDENDVIEYYGKYYNYNNSILHNLQNTNWTDQDRKDFERQAKALWSAIYGGHQYNYRYIDPSKKATEAIRLGGICFYETMEKTFLGFNNTFCQGCFLKMSDEMQIGWHMDWKTRLKK